MLARSTWRRVVGVAVALVAMALPVGAQEPLDATLGEQVLSIPSGGLTEPELEVTLFKPEGPGPFPLLMLNHGRAPGNAKFQSRWRPLGPVRVFVSRGWAVLVPMRQGFAKSGGSEIQGGCNVGSNGEQQARSVTRALAWAGTQPWADVSRNVVMGQSHGGLTTLAYGQAPHPGTRLLVNFAGGLRQEGCTAWQHNLIDAIAGYGAKTAVPSIWFYGDNDSYFAPFVFRGAFERYVQAGGRAELVAYGNFGSDAHAMFGSRAGAPIWLPKVMAALDGLGLPTQVLRPLGDPADVQRPAASGFAALTDADKVPLRNDRARDGYRAFLAAESPRAFAVHPLSANWGWAWGGEQPLARALANCARNAPSPCRLYAVDDAVVWTAE